MDLLGMGEGGTSYNCWGPYSNDQSGCASAYVAEWNQVKSYKATVNQYVAATVTATNAVVAAQNANNAAIQGWDTATDQVNDNFDKLGNMVKKKTLPQTM